MAKLHARGIIHEVWSDHVVVVPFTTEIVKLPIYEGLPEMSTFLIEFEKKVSKPHRLLALEEALKATPTHWWATHKK